MALLTTETGLNFSEAAEIHQNLTVSELVEHAIRNGEGRLASNGAFVAKTGEYTGRTPKDKFVVKEPSSEEHIWWDNNAPMDPQVFDKLRNQAQDLIKNKRIYIVDTFGGCDPDHRIRARFVTEKAWHALFVKTLLVRPTQAELENFEPDWNIVNLCTEPVDPAKDGTRSKAVIALNFASREVLIRGTEYAGEMKKSVFTILNYLLPLKGVLSMHCSANVGPRGDVALFFGLSGTGKTTLSADPERGLIGDDEHGWDEDGIFNFEGGCYAKCIRLSKIGEPQIYNAIRFGSVLENVTLNDRRDPDYDDGKVTENTRCAYPVEFIDGSIVPSVGGHPENIFFLTCDAFGVLPPISKLTPEQAMYHFLNGYTAKVAGTEAGVTEPQTTFSACFGAPFLPLPPKAYAELLKEKIAHHKANVWLVNTGWTGGGVGEGHRMSLIHTRALLHAALDGHLANVQYQTDPVFGLSIPTDCPGVPNEVLNPRDSWSDKSAYDTAAQKLRGLFEDNFKKFSQ